MEKVMLFATISILVLSGCSLFKITDCDSSMGDCDISGNNGTEVVSEVPCGTLPDGYTLDSYTVEKTLDTTCSKDSDCETPMEYMVQSRCPFTSICLENKCTVVCPDIESIEIQGEIIQITPEMDGSILAVTDGEITYEVLVSIPNLGEKYLPSIQKLELGKYIQVIGSPMKFNGSERIIASQIYVEGTFVGEHPCNLEPDPGQCEAAIPKYYFEKVEQKCREFFWGGCDGVVPFDNLDVCIRTCEGIPGKPELTKEACESDGGRVVNTLSGACGENEINIGELSGDIDCPCICCMVTGGSASAK